MPVVITESGDGLIFAALDHLLWTEEVAQAVDKIEKTMDANTISGENMIWIEGVVSELATAKLADAGWRYESEGLKKVE